MIPSCFKKRKDLLEADRFLVDNRKVIKCVNHFIIAVFNRTNNTEVLKDSTGDIWMFEECTAENGEDKTVCIEDER